jgi:hypothetical protein
MINVRNVGELVRCSATLVWSGTPHIEAALLAVDPPPDHLPGTWSLPVAPLRWGRLNEHDAWLDVEITGFPTYTGSRFSFSPADTYAKGWIKAQHGSRADCYQVKLDSPLTPWPEPHFRATDDEFDYELNAPFLSSSRPDGSGRWSDGLPGAMVTCGDLFLGLVVEDTPLVAGNRLTVVPAELLAAIIEELTREPIRLEPVGVPQDRLPTFRDDSGYVITSEDLDYLSITRDAFNRWLSEELPLGFSSITYEGFVDELTHALRRDGIDPGQVDIRLKGSSTAFFAGRHKTMPATRSEMVEAFRRLRGRLPCLFEVREIESRINKRWPLDLDALPLQRPFDAMHTMGIDRVRSDYDLQLSSDAIVAKCESYAEALGISPTRETTHHNVYNYVRWDLVRATMPYLTRFTDLMSDALQRDVSIAVFESAGPADLSAVVQGLSSHFKSTDWRITCPSTLDEGRQQ